jgi:hypothetical protein
LLTPKNRLTHAAAFELGDSWTWSEDGRGMMLSVYRSHNASATDYVYHVAQLCEDVKTATSLRSATVGRTSSRSRAETCGTSAAATCSKTGSNI